MMTNPKVIREFFENCLPPAIKKLIDFNTIEPMKDSFVGDNLKTQITDMLFSVKFNGKPGYFYLLLEHQSTSQKILPFRILKYMVAIQEQHLERNNTQELATILPFVIHTGKGKYRHSMDLFDLFGQQKELNKKILTEPYNLIDLADLADKDLEQLLMFGNMMLVAKHIHDRDIRPFLQSFTAILKELEKRGEFRYIKIILTYIVEANEIKQGDFVKIVSKGLKTYDENKLMTIAEQFRKEGILEGKEQGILEGESNKAKEIALKMLNQGMNINSIIGLTELSKKEIAKIKKTYSH